MEFMSAIEGIEVAPNARVAIIWRFRSSYEMLKDKEAKVVVLYSWYQDKLYYDGAEDDSAKLAEA